MKQADSLLLNALKAAIHNEKAALGVLPQETQTELLRQAVCHGVLPLVLDACGKALKHDPTLVASSIIELICDDLKYQDKQNDPQYMMLNNKLREDKRIHKIQKQMKKKEKRLSKHPERKSKHQKGKSKFANKYSERIDSIRTADERIQKEKKRLEKKNAERIRKERSNRNLENAKRTNTAKRMNTGKRMANNNKRSNQNRMEQLRKEMMQTLENSDIHSGKH